MSLSDKAKQDAKSDYAKKSGWFKFSEGINKIRVLAEPIAIYEDYKMGICYTGCGWKGSIKYLTYILDYADNGVKKMKIPYGIFQYIASLELDEDYKFEGFPMPYDLTISAVKAGTKEVEYSTKPRPTREPVPANILEELQKQKPVIEVIEYLKNDNKKKHGSDTSMNQMAKGDDSETGIEYTESEISPEDIPF